MKRTLVAMTLVGLAACSGTSSGLLGATQLTGAGSTFDFPFFSKAFYE